MFILAKAKDKNNNRAYKGKLPAADTLNLWSFEEVYIKHLTNLLYNSYEGVWDLDSATSEMHESISLALQTNKAMCR